MFEMIKKLVWGFLLCSSICLAADASGSNDEYSLNRIDSSKLALTGTSRKSATIDGVKYDVYYDGSSPMGAVVYCVNTGRKQLALTPSKHLSILNGLISDGYTVVVADFSAKRIDPGIALEKYVVTISENARKAAAKTSTPKNDYFPVMPGFTVKRNVVYFRYSDVPRPLQKLIARQKKKTYTTKHEKLTATMDIIYPKYGPPVPVFGNYGSSSQGRRQDYFATNKRHLVMSFALKNTAISHHHHWLDPYCGYTSPGVSPTMAISSH
ncbi:MAG: hypothetical protein ACJA16_001629 [Akkermansiaceae bacterium]|jgi:hypothetical protein